jgi:protoporphyrinogen oxidase
MKESAGLKRVVVIGAGPAGLTAAYELGKHGIAPVVLEKLGQVGGIARTENHAGYHFDMGGHRFFTKSAAVNHMWREVLGEEFLRRPRLSRILYEGKFYYYPLRALNALCGLGLLRSILIVLSYLKWRLFPYRPEETFEHWVTNRFGKKLFETFFKTYTEKVWGIPCSELKAEWAAQRIKNLSLMTAILSMFFKPRNTVKTLIEEFDYPRLGPGMMWSAVRDAVVRDGGKVRLNADVLAIHRQGKRITGITVRGETGIEKLTCTDVISSMPISELVLKLTPEPPADVVAAARRLSYRDFLTVCLIIDKPHLFDDNWIYIHDPNVKVGRIQNYKNWSPDMVPDQSTSSLGLEYFCNEGDDLWTMSDRDLVELGRQEVHRLGLADASDIRDGVVCRVPKAYPVYDSNYRGVLEVVRAYVDSLDNLQTIGRNGLHRYNNQDHAMLTGMLAVRNLVLGQKNDIWAVNADQEYHEELTDAQAKAKSEVPVATPERAPLRRAA